MRRVEHFTTEAYERALERHETTQRKAGRPLYCVIGATRQADNGADWSECFVDSGTRNDLRHRVVIIGSRRGVMFACDCEGHQYGRLCWHVAYALDELDLWGVTLNLPARQDADAYANVTTSVERS